MDSDDTVIVTMAFNRRLFHTDTTDWKHDMRLDIFDAELRRSLLPFLAQYQRHRNAYCRWCRLPAEILYLVFEQVKGMCGWPAVKTPRVWDDELEDFIRVKDAALSYDPGWIAVTHVCSFWREVALAAPGLWTDPDTFFDIPLSLMPLIMQRSRNLPLSLKFDGDTTLGLSSAERRLSQCLTPSVYRCLQDLCIRQVRPRMFERVADRLCVSVPLLRNLDVSVHLEDAEPAPSLPHNFTIGSPLVELSLESCQPPRWDLSFFGTKLTKLVLRCPQRTSPAFLPSASELAAILPSFASLVDLVIGDIFPECTSANAYPDIILPTSLRFFRIDASEDAALHRSCLVFLAHLSFPGNLHLEVDIEDPYDDSALGADALAVYSLTSNAIRNIYKHQSPPRELIIDDKAFLTHNREHDLLWPLVLNVPYLLVDPSFRDVPSVVYFSLEAPRVDPHGNQSFLSIPFHGLSGISLTCGGALAIQHQDAWWEALSGAEGVRRVVINMDSWETLARLAERAMENDGTSFALFPSLDTICIGVEDVAFVEDPEHHHIYETALTTLAALVRLRKELGKGLQELVVAASLHEWEAWNTMEENVHIRFE